MFWKFNYLTSDLDNLLDKEVRNASLHAPFLLLCLCKFGVDFIFVSSFVHCTYPLWIVHYLLGDVNVKCKCKCKCQSI